MIGRVRAESGNRCKLIFLQRSPSVFERRLNDNFRLLQYIDKIEQMNLENNYTSFMTKIWSGGKGEETELLRSLLVYDRHETQFFALSDAKVKGVYGIWGIYLNEFGKMKIEDNYLIESRFYALAVKNPLEPIYEQMKWIQKKEDELEIYDSSYMAKRKEEFIEFLLQVRECNNEEFQQIKRTLVKNYRNDFFPDILANNATLEIGKVQDICERYDLILEVSQGADRRNRYSIFEKYSKQEVL